MQRLTLSDRLVAGALGAFFGAVIGLVIAWLVGIFSHTLGPAFGPIAFGAWAGVCAAGFGLVGLIWGPAVGTALGEALSALLAFERFEPPLWLVGLVLAIAALAFWLQRSA